MVANKVQLINDGSLYCDEFIEDQSFPGEIKHKMYNDGRFSIEGELIEESGFEDLTTYTLVDPVSNAVVDSTSITITDLDTDWTTFYMYKDFGAAYFGANWEIQFELTAITIPAVEAKFFGVIKTDTAYGNDTDTNGPAAWLAYHLEDDTKFEFVTGDDSYARAHKSPVIGKYYCTLVRATGNPGSVTLYWYSDSARETLIDSVARTDIPLEYFDAHRYLMVGFSNRFEHSSPVLGSYKIENVKIISH